MINQATTLKVTRNTAKRLQEVRIDINDRVVRGELPENSWSRSYEATINRLIDTYNER